MMRIWRNMDRTIWSSHLVLLVISVFFVNFGQGLFQGASTNYFIDTLDLTGTQVLWLQGIREIPGLLLILIAAATMHWPLVRRAALSVLLMGVGYGLYAAINSYVALVAMALTASLGFHAWVPLQASLGMGLASKEHSGRVLGVLSASRSMAIIIGMGGLAIVSRLATGLSLRFYYVLGGGLIVLAAYLLTRLPKDLGGIRTAEPRMLIKRRYWLYYVLVLFEGVRTQVFSAFGTLVLVQQFALEVWHISLILLVSGVVNLVASPVIGKLLDRVGERKTLTGGYLLLALGFAGYATLTNPWLLSGALVFINMLFLCNMGLNTYVNRIAPREELTPTLSAGVSFNHVTSVSMSFVAGSLLALAGYQAVAWGAVGIILLSIPFAMAIRTDREPVQQEQAAPVTAQ
jgi:predicted MFS family arabinose efflux permease